MAKQELASYCLHDYDNVSRIPSQNDLKIWEEKKKCILGANPNQKQNGFCSLSNCHDEDFYLNTGFRDETEIAGVDRAQW